MVATLLRVILIFSTLAEIGLVSAKMHPGHPGKCWIEGQAVEVGGLIISKERCAGIWCEKDKKGFLKEKLFLCPPSTPPPPPCFMVEDDSVPFPKCCPRQECRF